MFNEIASCQTFTNGYSHIHEPVLSSEEYSLLNGSQRNLLDLYIHFAHYLDYINSLGDNVEDYGINIDIYANIVLSCAREIYKPTHDLDEEQSELDEYIIDTAIQFESIKLNTQEENIELLIRYRKLIINILPELIKDKLNTVHKKLFP